ncbi:MAG: MFS transporter [Steroidobacteraceae bacterium]|jgi:Na+/melibiose symporter-like transporter|nr:MFS transporter [Steroidobacteraceae bacterium]
MNDPNDRPPDRSHSGADATVLAAPSVPTRLAFGFTAVVETTKFQVYEIFLIFYYAQVLGLKGSLAGLAVAIATIADALIDPLIGSYSDSFRGPLGRRHTLMFLAIAPTGLFVWLLFSVPAGLGQAGLFAWLLALCLAVRITGSFYAVPAAAVAAELTEDAKVRAELGIWRQAVTAAVGSGLTWLLFNLAFADTGSYSRGQENPDNYPRFALLVVGVLMLGALLGAAGTLRPIQAFERARVAVKPRVFSVKASLLATWRALADLPNFRMLFLGLLFAGVMGSYFRALNLHLGTYFWGLSTQQTGTWLMSIQVATFVAAIASRLVVGRVEPKTLYVSGVATMMLAYVLPPLARLLDLMPPNGSAALVQLLYLSNVAVGAGTGLIMACSLVMFAETADEYAYEKRESRTGMLLAFLPLGNKMASSLGKLAAGIVVQWVALPVGRQDVAPDAGALQLLGIAAVSLTALAGCVALGFYSGYHLPRARHAEIVRGLEALRAASPTRNA